MTIDLLKKNDEFHFEKGLQKRLTIDGQSKEYESFKVPIKYLFYNERNGRIATYIQQYREENKEKSLAELLIEDREKYNKILGAYIKDSASDRGSSYRETKEDIKNRGQQVPGVVLSDGRVIDGNRRFTAIEELYEEKHDSKFEFFEAVILPAPKANDKDGWKRIKGLELNLQFNVDDKRDYDRIDFFASFYEDTIKEGPNRFDKKSYIHASGMKESNYEKNVKIIKIMLDYLKWRNRPESFYILKKDKLDGPLEEMAKLLNKKISIDEYNQKKLSIYQYITFTQRGDKTRDTRELVNSICKGSGSLYNKFEANLKKENNTAILLDALNIIDRVDDTVEDTKEKKEKLKQVNGIIIKAFTDAQYDDKTEKSKKTPVEKLEAALKQVKQIDLDGVENLNDNFKEDMRTNLKELLEVLNKIGEVLNNG